MREEIYISTDIETDGPCPGLNSMLSFGSAAFLRTGKMIGTFSRNLEQLPEARPDPDTTAWWLKFPAAWDECRRDPVLPVVAMHEYVLWLGSFKQCPVFLAYPAGFDYTFMNYYLHRFATNPFPFSALDIKTYAAALLKQPFYETTKKKLPKEWFGTQRHTHVALDDAIEQGELFMAMLRFNEAASD